MKTTTDEQVPRSAPTRETRPVSHDEAKEVAARLITGSFRRDGERLDYDERPHFSIPTQIDDDDDCLIVAYVAQQRANEARLTARIRELEEGLAPVAAQTPLSDQAKWMRDIVRGLLPGDAA